MSIKSQKGLAVLEILVAAVIIAILFYFVSKIYFKKPSLDERTQQTLSEQGISTSSYQGMVKDADDRVKDFNKETEKRQKQIDEQ